MYYLETKLVDWASYKNSPNNVTLYVCQRPTVKRRPVSTTPLLPLLDVVIRNPNFGYSWLKFPSMIEMRAGGLATAWSQQVAVMMVETTETREY